MASEQSAQRELFGEIYVSITGLNCCAMPRRTRVAPELPRNLSRIHSMMLGASLMN